MSHSDRPRGEFEYIDWIRQRVAPDRRVLLGIGDDAAALHITPGRNLLVTTDMILEGVHFDSTHTPVRLVGRKAMAVNLSDIAAMAGIPVAAVVAVGLPDGFTSQQSEELFHGIHELATEFGVALIGGDTNRSRSGLVVAITLLGETSERGCVRRDGARTGDWIMVTGSLGGSIRGKHLSFTPRVREATLLHERYGIHAMIDISDGLAADLGHILDASGCGAILSSGKIPISEAARQCAKAGRVLESALYDGEDFELLMTLDPHAAGQLLADQPLDVPIACIGEITEAKDYLLQAEDGAVVPIERRGYDHFRK
jgi:thiamine-monophosphate kinase